MGLSRIPLFDYFAEMGVDYDFPGLVGFHISIADETIGLNSAAYAGLFERLTSRCCSERAISIDSALRECPPPGSRAYQQELYFILKAKTDGCHY